MDEREKKPGKQETIIWESIFQKKNLDKNNSGT